MTTGEQRPADTEGVGEEIAPPAKKAPASDTPEEVVKFDEEHVRNFYKYIKGDSDGVVELRAIKDGKILTGYFDIEDDFVAACRRLNGKMQVYAGVNPRPVRMLDKSRNRVQYLEKTTEDADIEIVQTQVIDADPVRPKDTGATKVQVQLALDVAKKIRAWAEEQGWASPPVVMSGNGGHVSFAYPPIQLGDEEHRVGVAAQLKNFETAIREKFTVDGIKIDSISNFSRIIKVPGTMSIKGESTPERPHRRARYMTDHKRVEDVALGEHILSLPTTVAKAGKKPKLKVLEGGGEKVVIADKISARALQVIRRNKNNKAHWEGRGKPEIGLDGRTTDISRTGYDWTVALDLIRGGVTDPGELATALYYRPNGAAKEKGEAYAIRTAERALEFCDVDGEEKRVANFSVTGAVITSSNPKIFKLLTSRGELVIGAEQLAARKVFNVCFLNAFGLMPVLSDDDERRGWDQVVNGWVEGATVEVLPPEASEEFQQMDAVYRAVEELSEGEDVEDLDTGQYLMHRGRKVFKASAVAKAVNNGRSARDQLGTQTVCTLLRKLGCDYPNTRINAKKVRVYEAPERWPDEITGEDAPDPIALGHTEYVQLPLRFVDPHQLLLPGLARFVGTSVTRT